MPSALSWARQASQTGVRIVGASSLTNDPAQSNYAEWTVLPWVVDAGFAPALECYVREKKIDGVFTAHPVVWQKLHQLLPNLPLESEQPWAADLASYREYREIAAGFVSHSLDLAAQGDPRAALPLTALAALVRVFRCVPGECDYTKLETLAAIFRWMPPGDIVEIGSLWGRSAVALAFLSQLYKVGSLACVDPWSSGEIHQEIPAVDAVFDDAPMDDIFEAFRVNLAPFQGIVNYLRAPSSEAVAYYSSTHSVTTPDFGYTSYAGEIALLHIDGNHSLEAVRQDIALWRGFVRPGGWIVIDDYCWPFGDGPRTAADEFCARARRNIALQFVAGGALFVQLTRGAACPAKS